MPCVQIRVSRKDLYSKTASQNKVYMVYSVVTTEPALTVILSGQFVAKQLQFLSSAEAKSWWPKL